jgi:peptidoglycan/xylan/chitin deacetylase (PgdA/CDA1 family)
MTATFFLTNVARGKNEFDNQSADFANIVRRMHAEGHQLGSHTWSHEDLSSLTHEERVQEMVKNEMAFRNLFGFFPTYMRPPYGDCTSKSNCTEDIAKLGYHIVNSPIPVMIATGMIVSKSDPQFPDILGSLYPGSEEQISRAYSKLKEHC